MGWWKINSVTNGGIDWSKGNKEEMYNGDGPADIMSYAFSNSHNVGAKKAMNDALKELNEEYEQAWHRKPMKQELRAAFNFAASVFSSNVVARCRIEFESIIAERGKS